MRDPRKDTNRTDRSDATGTAPAAESTSQWTAEAAQQAKQASDAVEATAVQTAAVSEHTLAAAAEIVRTGNEAVQQTVQSGLDMATQITERVARAFGLPDQATTETTKHATQNVQVLMDCGTVIAHGLQDISREWLDQTRDRFRKNLDGVSALLRARTPQDAIAVQSDLARETLKDLLADSRLASERMASVTQEAMKVVAAQDR